MDIMNKDDKSSSNIACSNVIYAGFYEVSGPLGVYICLSNTIKKRKAYATPAMKDQIKCIALHCIVGYSSSVVCSGILYIL